jgi:hypothetical protein
MFQIENLTDNALQVQTLILEDGTSILMTLYFSQVAQGWFIQNLTYGTFILSGFKVVNSPNLLYQWQNILPFGLACFSINNNAIDPSFVGDFLSGNSSLYILTQAECQQYAEFLSGQ